MKFPNKIDEEKVICINGIKEGNATYYYSNGDKEEYTYINGIKQGEAIYYYFNKDEEEYIYIDGIKQGKAVYYFYSNSPYVKYLLEKEDYFYIKNGMISTFLSDREDYTYINGIKQGESIYHHFTTDFEEFYNASYRTKDIKEISFYINGIKQGETTIVYRDEKILGNKYYVTGKTTYIDGVKQGKAVVIEKIQYKSGKVCKLQYLYNYINGKRNGEVIVLVDDNKKFYKCNFLNDKLNGKYLNYFSYISEKGEIEEEIEYDNGKKIHIIKYNIPDTSKKIREVFYDDNELAKNIIIWNDDETRIECQKNKGICYYPNGDKEEFGINENLFCNAESIVKDGPAVYYYYYGHKEVYIYIRMIKK